MLKNVKECLETDGQEALALFINNYPSCLWNLMTVISKARTSGEVTIEAFAIL